MYNVNKRDIITEANLLCREHLANNKDFILGGIDPVCLGQGHLVELGVG
jgi:hypothetical protein